VRVAILDDYTGVALESADWDDVLPEGELTVFDQPIPPADRARVLQPFDVIIAMRERMPLDAELLRALPGLRLVVTTGMRNNAIDVVAAEQLGIVVAGTSMKAGTAAELTWALILAMVRSIPANDASVRSGGWQSEPAGDIAGETLGVMGLGRLGTRVAEVGRALGMQVVAWSPRLTRERAEEVGVEAVSRADLFRRSRVVSLHLVLAESTRGIVGWPELEALGRDGYLVNTSRAGLVDDAALRRALEGGTIAGVALDVFDQEPLPPGHWIRSAPRTLLSPHMGYVTRHSMRVCYGEAAQDIRGWLDGATPRALGSGPDR
jgi:phosphoglycerate dehydrogenase-like enzyme